MPRVGLRAFDKFHVHRDFNFQHVDAVAIFAELAHALGHDLRLFLGVFETLLVCSFFVANKLQEKRNVVGAAFVADAFHPRMLLVVYFFGVEGRVVKQNFDAVRTRFFQTSRGPVIEQVAEAAGAGFVVSGFFVGQ